MVSCNFTDAEYRALADGVKEAVYLKRLVAELRLSTDSQIPVDCSDEQTSTDLSNPATPSEVDIHLHCDNSSAIQLARNPVFHARSKHIELHHHFVKERIIQQEVTINYNQTTEQPADILTRALPQAVFEKHRLPLESALYAMLCKNTRTDPLFLDKCTLLHSGLPSLHLASMHVILYEQFC
jgi:hypothetical protein